VSNKSKTILYLTDNRLDERLARRCMELLVKVSLGMPIVSVSQKPIDLGHNICVGDIGSSGPSLETQLYEGLKHVDTRWVMMAEHDCVYSEEYMRWNPPDDEFFWYNDNCWLCQLHNPRWPEMDGLYSFMGRRRAQSQLQCNTERFRAASGEKLAILTSVEWRTKYPKRYLGEPGTCDPDKAMKLTRFANMRQTRKDIKNYMTEYQAREWRSAIPNIDIRHGANFTGPRRGKLRTYSLDPWGTIYEVLGEEFRGYGLT